MATFETVYASLPTEPHARGAAFERLCQWWLQNDPVYTDQLRQVWLWDDWPGRWGPDTGIDLVAETHTGDLWAIQAKAYDADYSVTKTDIDSFLSESNRPAFAYRLLVATTDRIGANGRRVLRGQEKAVGQQLRGDLAARDVVWPAHVSDLRVPQPAAKRPREHQDEAYVAREGHARVPQRFEIDGRSLGKWVDRQRKAHRNEALDSEREVRLESLKGWEWDPLASEWEEYFAALEAYVAREGHARVPSKFQAADGRRLGRWVHKQRSAFVLEELDPERSSRLAALEGWIWDLETADWEANFAALKAYVAREGHAQVPGAFQAADGRRLGSWVAVQCRAYRRGTLDPERSARLAALEGWIWDVAAFGWEANFAALEAYVDREGHARVPATFQAADGWRLRGWVSKQRSAYRKGELDPERSARLAALPGWLWDAKAPKT